MVQVLTIILCVCFLGIAVCLIALLILDTQMKKCDKHLKELDDIGWHLEHGTPMEEILKMPMPKKLRKEFAEIHEQYKAECNSIYNEIEHITNNAP